MPIGVPLRRNLVMMARSIGRGGGALLPVMALLGSMLAQLSVSAYAKGLFPLIGAAGVTTLRATFAALILLVVWRPWRFPLSLREARFIGLYGAMLGAMNLFFLLSIATIPLGVSLAIQFAGPLGVALATSRRWIDLAWITLALLGLVLLLPLRDAASLDPLGVVYACAGGASWGLYIVFGRRAGLINGGQAVSLGMATAALVVAPFGWSAAGTELFAVSTLILGFGIAVLASALPYSLEMAALRRIDGKVFGTLMSLQPVVGALVALVLLHEVISPVQWLAIVLIVIASIGITTGGGDRVSGREQAKAAPSA